jgi:hypothetical protein
MRPDDIGLFLAALVGASLVLGLRRFAMRRAVISAPAILLASSVAVLASRLTEHALQVDFGGVEPAQWAGGSAVGLLAGVGAMHLHRVDGHGVVVPGLVLAALVGMWLGVPETSHVIVAGALVVSVAGVTLVSSWPSATVPVLLPVLALAAGVLGAVGISQATAAACLAIAPLGMVVVAPPVAMPARRASVLSVGLAVTAGLVAARHLGVNRDWDGVALVSGTSLTLSWLSAAALRVDQSAR